MELYFSMKDEYRVMWEEFKTITPSEWKLFVAFVAIVAVVCGTLALVGACL